LQLDNWRRIASTSKPIKSSDHSSRLIVSAAIPPIVYHYTNDVGLKGIQEVGQLWLTDIFDLAAKKPGSKPKPTPSGARGHPR
jgi:hypothetical protein